MSTTTAAAEEAPNESGCIAGKLGLGLGIPVVVLSVHVSIAAWYIRSARKQRAISSEAHHKAEHEKLDLGADAEFHAELDTAPSGLPAQILEAELSEEGIMAELLGKIASQS